MTQKQRVKYPLFARLVREMVEAQHPGSVIDWLPVLEAFKRGQGAASVAADMLDRLIRCGSPACSACAPRVQLNVQMKERLQQWARQQG